MSASDHHDTPGVSASGVVYSLMTLFCWTVTPLFVEYLTGLFDVWESNGWRYGMAALVWLPMLIMTIAKGDLPGSIWKRALIPAFFSVIAQVAFVAAFYQIEPGMLSIGLRVQMVATAIGAYFLFPGERPIIRKPTFLIGAVAIMLGVIGVAYFADTEGEARAAQLKGTLLAMVAGAGYAGYAMGVRKCLAGVSARISFSVISLYVGGAMVGLMIWRGQDPVTSLRALDGGQWVLLLLSVAFGLALGHVLYFTAMEKLGVSAASGVIQLQPLTVAVGSYFAFGEILNGKQIGSGLMAIAGAGIMLYTQHAVSKQRKVHAMRELDELPVDPPVAMEEAERVSER
ncbi:MAG: DMT family transporter [Planctomycetota bacterium]